MNALVLSRISYMLPTYSNCTNVQLDKLHKLLMKAACYAIGNYCFKKSTGFILSSCKFMPIRRMLLNAALKIIQKSIYTRQPRTIFNIYKFGTRMTAPISTKQAPKSKSLSNFFPYKYLQVYNSIPNSLKLVTDRKFKHNIKKGKIAVNMI